MRYAVFSDIHSNLEALNAALGYYKKESVDSYICCGDIVGYGPDPKECIELIAALPDITAVMGNHDAAVCGFKDIRWFHEQAKEVIIWTEKQLAEKDTKYLCGLPRKASINDMTVVHGSPSEPINEYLLTVAQMKENLKLFTEQICLVGHTHAPFIFAGSKKESELLEVKGDLKIILETGKRYIINPGSVGQPRDSNPLASCAIYDTAKREFGFVRLKYDIKTTQRKMASKKLPQYLIERLALGS